MSNVWLKLNHSLQHECGTGCALLDPQILEGRLSPCVPAPFAPLLFSELPCTAGCDSVCFTCDVVHLGVDCRLEDIFPAP